MRARLPILLLLAVAAAGTSYYFLIRPLSPPPAATSDADPQHAVPSFVFGSLPITRFDANTSDSTTLKSALMASMQARTYVEPTRARRFNPQDPRTSASLQALAGEVAEFFHQRFVTPSADEYLRWRRSPKVDWFEREYLSETWFVAKDFQFVTGRAFTPDVSVESAFRTLFDDALADSSSKLRFEGVCLDAVQVCFATQTDMNDQFPALSAGRSDKGVDDDLWYGSVGQTMRPWFNANARRIALLKSSRSVQVAVVGLPLVNAAGTRVPIILEWFFDPQSNRWIIESMYINNIARSDNFGTLNF